MKTEAISSSAFSHARRSWKISRAAVVLAGALMLPGCTQQQSGNSSSYLIVDSVEAAAGSSTQFGGSLASDVTTNGIRWSDNGLIKLRLAMTDPGTVESPTEPTSANFITVTRYRVTYTRNDGGVNVPASFEGAATATVGAGVVGIPITLVRAQAKFDFPLADLVGVPTSIPTIAEITLFGSDQAGRAVSVKGFISVIFADWAD